MPRGVRATFVTYHVVALEQQSVLLSHTVNPSYGDGELSIVLPDDPILFEQVPDVKFEVLGRACQ